MEHTNLKLGTIVEFDYTYESGVVARDLCRCVKAIDHKHLWVFKQPEPFMRERMSNVRIIN